VGPATASRSNTKSTKNEQQNSKLCTVLWKSRSDNIVLYKSFVFMMRILVNIYSGVIDVVIWRANWKSKQKSRNSKQKKFK
jgi:hypothetical protein